MDSVVDGLATARMVRILSMVDASPWENRSCESFNSKLRDEVLNGI